MDFDKFMDWVVGITIFCILMSIPVLVWFVIYKEIHCWGLDPATAPIECQRTHTLNVNEK